MVCGKNMDTEVGMNIIWSQIYIHDLDHAINFLICTIKGMIDNSYRMHDLKVSIHLTF